MIIAEVISLFGNVVAGFTKKDVKEDEAIVWVLTFFYNGLKSLLSNKTK